MRPRETVPDMMNALLSRKPQALSLRDSLHNNHISVNNNKKKNQQHKKKISQDVYEDVKAMLSR